MAFFDLINKNPLDSLFGDALYAPQKPLQSEYTPTLEVGSLLAGTPLSKSAIDSERYADKLRIEVANSDAARNLVSVDMPLDLKVEQIKQLQQPVVERPVGDIYADRAFKGLDPMAKGMVAESVTTSYEQENATKAYMHALGVKDYNDYSSPEDILSLPVPSMSDMEAATITGGKRGSLMKEEMLKKEFEKINSAAAKEGLPPLRLPENISELTTTQALDYISSGRVTPEAEQLLMEFAPTGGKNVGTTKVGTQTIKDFLYYSSAYPVDKNVELEFKNIVTKAAKDPSYDMWDAVTELDSQINARYGDEAYKMMAALMAREGLEWAAVGYLLRGTGVIKGTSSWAWKTFAQNAAFAAVGSEAERAVDRVFNKESADRLTDYTTRFVFGVAGEGVAKLAGKVAKSFVKPKAPLEVVNEVAQTTGQTKAAVDLNERVLQDVLNPKLDADGKPVRTTSGIVGVPKELVEAEVLSNGYVSGNPAAQGMGDAALIRANQSREKIPVSHRGKKEEIEIIMQHVDDEVTNIPTVKEETTGVVKKGQSNLQVLRAKDAIVNEIVDPMFSVGKNVVRNLGVAENTRGKVQENLASAIKTSFKGLNKKEVDKVYSVLIEGDELEKTFSKRELFQRGLTPTQAEAYESVRMTLDKTASVLDGHYVRSYKANGIKAYKDDFVKPVGKGEPDEKGMVLVYPKDGTAAQAFKVPLAELEEVTQVLRTREGYFPIVYDAKYAVSELDKKTGKFSRVAALKTAKEGKKALAKFEVERDSEDKLYFLHRWDTARGALDLGLADRTQKLMDALDTETFESVKKALQDAGIDAESLTYSYDLAHPNAGMRKSVGTAARGIKRIGTRMPPADALANYFSRVANAVTYDQWRVDAIRKLDADAEKYLVGSGVYNRSAPLGERVNPAKATPATRRMADQLRRTEEFIAYALSGRSLKEKELDALGAALVDDLAKSKNPALNKASDILRDMGLDRPVSNTKRALLTTGYTTRLWGNINAMIPQLAQFIPSTGAMVGTSPKAYLRTMYEGMDMMMSVASNKYLGRPLSKNNKAIIKELEESGWLNAKDFTDISDVMTQTDIGTGRSVLRGIGELGAAPIQIPEKMVRFYSYMFARNDNLRLLKRGELNGFNGKFTGKVGDAEWRNLVVEKAKAYALDYSKTGKIGVNRGTTAIVSQFAQFSFKQFAQMTYDPRIPLRGKLGAWGATALAFGTANALPFGGDAVNFADYVMSEEDYSVDSTTNPAQLSPVSDAMKVSIKAYRDEIKNALNEAGYDGNKVDKVLRAYTTGQGAFDLLTDEELVIFHRVTASTFISDMIANWYDMGEAIDPSRFSVGLFSIATILQSGKNIAVAWKEYIDAEELNRRIEAGERPDLAEYNKEAADSAVFARSLVGEIGRSWSAVGSQVRYWANATKPRGSNIETMSGTSYPVGTDDTAIKGILFGAMPADMFYAFRDKNDSNKRAEILEDSMYEIVKGYENNVLKLGYSPNSAQAAEYIKKAVLKVRIMETYSYDVVHDMNALEKAFGGVSSEWSLLPDRTYQRGAMEKMLLNRIMNASIKNVNKLPSRLPNVTSTINPEGVKKLEDETKLLEERINEGE